MLLKLSELNIACNHSMQSYFYNDDTFNFNYAQAKAAVGNYKEAEEVRIKINFFQARFDNRCT